MFALLASISLILVPAAMGVDLHVPVPDQRLEGSDTTAEDEFGATVAISEDTLAVGAPENGPGAVYVFTLEDGSWEQTERLEPSKPGAETFGRSLALDEDTLVVGDPFAGSNGAGLVTVYGRTASGWAVDAELQTTENDLLGSSVALDGEVLAVGAEGDSAVADGAGAVYVYRQDATGTWVSDATLTALDGDAGDDLGSSVGVDGTTVVAGAEHDEAAAQSSGSAYVFERSQGVWTQTAKLFPADGDEFDEFGKSVDVDAGTVVVGAWRDDRSGSSNTGAVYVYVEEDGAWTHVDTLGPALDQQKVQFGRSVSIAEGLIVVGAPGDRIAGELAGGVYTFVGDEDRWIHSERLSATETTHLGISVATDGGSVLAGAPFEDRHQDPAVYVWNGLRSTVSS